MLYSIRGDLIMGYYSDAQKKATAKYMKKSYDDIKIRVYKGQRKKLQQAVFNLNYESFNQFVLQAIYEKITLENKLNPSLLHKFYSIMQEKENFLIPEIEASIRSYITKYEAKFNQISEPN